MVLPTTGPLSFGDINVELGRPRGQQLNFNDAAARALAGKPSGQISISDFRGKSAMAVSGHVMVAGRRTSGSKFVATDTGFTKGIIGSMSPTTVGGYSIGLLHHTTLTNSVMFICEGVVPSNLLSRIEVWSGSTMVFSSALGAGSYQNGNTIWTWGTASNPFVNGATYNVKIFY